MKKINYFGKEYEVSDKVNYVATDYNGSIWGYDAKPDVEGRSFAFNGSTYVDRLGGDSEVAKNWESSLRQVKDIIVKENKLKVGDKVELLGDYCGFKKGQVVELYSYGDDGIHLFKGSNDRHSHCDGKDGAYLQDCSYKVITPTADKKTFKIRCVDNKGNSHFTTGREYDCFTTGESCYKWVNCDFSHLNPCYLGQTLDNAHGTFEMVDEYKPHPHADLMLKYAMITQYDDKPWESFDCDLGKGVWCDMFNTNFHTAFNYRLKPQEPKIQIGQVWTSMEDVDVMIDTPSDAKTIYFSFNVFGCHYKNFAPIGEFMRNFKRKK